MSDVLAVAVWRARMAKQAPRVVNVINFNDEKLRAAQDRIAELEKQNVELKGKIGGLTCKINRQYADQLPTEIPKFVKISEIAETVSREFRIAVIDMQSERRTRDVIGARQVAMYLCRKISNRSFPVIGKFFGNRDHTTVMHAYNSIGDRRAKDSALDATIRRLEHLLYVEPRSNPTEAVKA